MGIRDLAMFSRCAGSVCQAQASAAADGARDYWWRIGHGVELADLAAWQGRGHMTARMAAEAAANAAVELAIVCWVWQVRQVR